MNEEQQQERARESNRAIARATGSVSVLTLLSRILGLVRDMATASYFGAGQATDAFFVAFKVPNLLRRLVAEGSLSTAFIPVFTSELFHSKEESKRAVGAVTAFSLLITTTLTVLGVIYAEPLTLFFAPGFGVGTEKTVLATSLMRVMFPYVILVSLSALATSILNALGRFAIPAAGPAILNMVLIFSIFFEQGVIKKGIYSLAFAVVIGGMAALIPQMIQLRRLGFELHLRSPFRSRAVYKLCLLMLPTLLSSSVYQLMIFINTNLASLLAEGSVSWLYYADRLFQFPLGVFSIAVATAVLPTLSRQAAAGDLAGLSTQLRLSLEWVSYITIPATLGLVILSEPLIRVIYQHGTFSPADTAPTAFSLQCYSIGLWAISCQSLIVRAFLANKNSHLPALISTVTILLNVILALGFMGTPVLDADTDFARWIVALQSYLGFYEVGPAGLALAGSIASLFSMVLLLWFLPWVGARLNYQLLIRSIARSTIASLAMGLALYFVMRLGLHSLATLVLGVPLGLAVFFGASALLHAPEAKQTIEVFKQLKTRLFKV